MLAIDQEVLPELEPIQFSVVSRESDDDYRSFVTLFEETAEMLLARVDRALERAFRDHEIVALKEWRQEAIFLARHLSRYPWLIVGMSCPPEYETLQLLYREWADTCVMLGDCLRSLVRNDGQWSIEVLISYADEELAAVTAHTTARSIYLASLDRFCL